MSVQGTPFNDSSPVGRMLRIQRLGTAVLTAWVLVSIVTGIGIVLAAGSTHFQMETDPLNFTDGMHGASDTFQLDGRTTWREDTMESTNFQILHNDTTISLSSSSSSSSSSTSSVSSSSSTNSTTSGGNRGGGRGTPSPSGGNTQGGGVVVAPSSSGEVTNSFSSLSREVSSSASSKTEEAKEVKAVVKTGRVEPKKESIFRFQLNTFIDDRMLGLHGAATEDSPLSTFLICLAIVIQGMATLLLFSIYQFEAAYSVIPAYQSSKGMLWAVRGE